MNAARVLAVLIATTLLSMVQASAQPSAALMWKARALEAGNTLKVLQGKLAKIPHDQWNSKEAMRVKCEVMLESAYASHIALEDIAHKTEGDLDFFRLILSGGEERGLFDLVYIYGRGMLLTTRIDLLPRGWKLFLLRSNAVELLLPEGCVFHFDLNDPYSAKVSR